MVKVIPKPLCLENDCHNNVHKYVHNYGGERISGYYLITDAYDDNYGCAVYHSIWRNTYGELVDITPFYDRSYNVFSIHNGEFYYPSVSYDGATYEVTK